MIDEIKEDAKRRMGRSIEAFRDELRRLRTGRAHTGLLDHISVEYYGTEVPISQAATVGVEDARTLTVSPWEKSMVSVIEKAIINSNLGLTPMTAGSMIRVPLPPMTEDRRKDLVRVVRAEAESGRIAIRNVRRDAINDVKDLVKEKMATEDEERRAQDDIQKLTDAFVAQVDELLKEKEEEIMAF